MNKNKKKALFLVSAVILTALFFLLFNKYYSDQPELVKLTMDVSSDSTDQYKVYYDLNGDKEWSEEKSDSESYKKAGKYQKLSFNIPAEAKNIRVDFGNKTADINVKNVSISDSKSIDVDYEYFNNCKHTENDMKIEETSDSILVKADGVDPYVLIENTSDTFNTIVGKKTYLICIFAVISLILGIVMGKSLMQLKNSIDFIKSAFCNKGLIWNLAKNDFKQKYATSYLGIIWGFINPLITIAVYWFVFQVGLRQTDVGNAPFILWFICGIIPWFFFQEGLSSCTNVFVEYSYLVKKVVFKIETLPVIKIISTLFVHCFFILFLIGIAAVYGYYPDLSMLQFIYYSFSMVVLVFCVTIFTSAVILFFRDLGQIIAIIINVGFWATPIGWNIQMVPEALRVFLKLNPMFYIVNGYRDAFIENIFFWQRPYQTLYFWGFCLFMLLIGVKVFNKLKPHFSDVI